MALHITYNNGANPFFMINVSAETIQKELAFQIKRNIHLIQNIYITGGTNK